MDPPNDQKGLLVVLLLTFWYSNTLLTIQIGQISSILLISIVVGAYWMDRKKFFLAGSILSLLTIKPPHYIPRSIHNINLGVLGTEPMEFVLSNGDSYLIFLLSLYGYLSQDG